MLGLNPSMRFYLCEGPVDMRKGIFTLAELVRKIMGKEPSTGDIFIFLSKDRRNIKILHHDTGGYVLYWKKLRGRRGHRGYSEGNIFTHFLIQTV